MLNRIVIQGRLTRDPELRRTQNGIAVTSFSLAVERSFKSQSGERETDFFDVVAWRNTAEFVTKYFTKGRMAIVEGRLEFRDWVDREGQKRRSAEVVAENVHFAGDAPRRDNSGEYGAPSYGASPAYASGSGGYAAAPYGSAPGYGSFRRLCRPCRRARIHRRGAESPAVRF